VALLLPSLHKARKQAKLLVCMNQLRQIGMALHSYANDNDGHLFSNRNAIFSNDYTTTPHTPLSFYGTPEQWTCGPIATANPVASGWPWADPGGPDGYIEGLYPKYIKSARIFMSPSAEDHCYSYVPDAYRWYLGPQGFEDYMLGKTTYYQWWISYIGAVYGKLGKHQDGYAHGGWDSYWIQGYYPYSEEYLAPKGSILWDIGSLSFYFGAGHPAAPRAPEGIHRVGGHFLMVDNSVMWRKYPWIIGNE
jgi:hypothetical protein